MNDEIKTSPNNEYMIKAETTHTTWLKYYKNVWTRNTVAKAIDIRNDQILKAEDRDQLVVSPDGQTMIPVWERLEMRKEEMKSTLTLIKAIDEIIALDNFDSLLTDEALDIDPELKKEIEAGDAVDANVKETPAAETEQSTLGEANSEKKTEQEPAPEAAPEEEKEATETNEQ